MKLQPLLDEYLLENRNLPLQEIGRLSFKEKAAVVIEEHSKLLSPQVILEFKREKITQEDKKKLVNFISTRLSISQEQATKLLTEEGSLQNASTETEKVNWSLFGHFHKQEDKTFSFVTADVLNSYLPVISLKQNKQQPETVLIDETIEPAEQEVLNEPDYILEEPLPKKDNWWIWAIVILVISVALILFRYL